MSFSFGDLHGIMMNTPGSDTYSPQEFIKPTSKSNGLEVFLHPPIPMSYYPPLSMVPNKDGHAAPSTSSCEIYGPQSLVSSNATSRWCLINASDYPKHNRAYSDITLNYIEEMLMQENDDKVRSHPGETALRTMEEPFYKILGENYPTPPMLQPLCTCDHLMNLNGSIIKFSGQSCGNCSTDINSSNHLPGSLQAFQDTWSLSAIVGGAKYSTQGTQRMEIGLNIDDLSITKRPTKNDQSLQMNAKDTIKHASLEVGSRKGCPSIEDLDLLEGRSNKQFAVSCNEQIRNEMFDKFLLCCENTPVDEGIILQGNTSSKHSQNDQHRTSVRQKMRGKIRQQKEVVDLRTLLIHCAQAVALNDGSLATNILKTIRKHSSPSGDDSQRLAFLLADCLEVRLAGTGSQIYRKLISRQRNAADMLKVSRLCFTISPLLRASYYFSNKIILDVSNGRPRVHIVDFGICFGFQWPSLFKQFANREGGPPKLRITGVELPQPGFRPNEMNENTWLRLVEYAHMFNVPFEYQQISLKWEAISIEDFNIEKGELLVVNCIYRMRQLGDETICTNSARNRVLNTIRMMKPKVFIHGIANGSYSSPFFLTRFKEVMYHYTGLFDMLDRTTPRDNETRMILERDVYQSVMLNVIACEGSERIERPESYKWKVQNLKAKLEQLTLTPAIVKGTQHMVTENYHKDFFVDNEDQWLVLGWKGRILYALSTWKTNGSEDGD